MPTFLLFEKNTITVAFIRYVCAHLQSSHVYSLDFTFLASLSFAVVFSFYFALKKRRKPIQSLPLSVFSVTIVYMIFSILLLVFFLCFLSSFLLYSLWCCWSSYRFIPNVPCLFVYVRAQPSRFYQLNRDDIYFDFECAEKSIASRNLPNRSWLPAFHQYSHWWW